MIHEHIVELKIGDTVIDTWQRFSIDHDFLSPADTFDMTFGVASWDPRIEPEPIVLTLRRAGKAMKRVELRIDGALQLTGYLDVVDGEEDDSGPLVRVQGRDVGGQVVDEPMPLGWNIVGLRLVEVLERTLDKWNIPVVVGNEANRTVLTTKKQEYKYKDAEWAKKQPWWKNKAGKPKYDESTTEYSAWVNVIRNRKLANELKAEPEQTRWDWIAKLLKTQNLLGWFSADGKFIVGIPNYDQEPMFHATRVVEIPGVQLVGKRQPSMNNLEGGGYTSHPGTRYSKVIVLGRQGKDPIKAVATDEELIELDVDKPSYHVDHDIRSIEEAQRVADRMLVNSKIKDETYTCTLTGFGQGDRLFAFDTIWDVWDDSPAVRLYEQLYCTKLTQKYDLEAGPTTEVTLQPKGIIEVPT